MRPGFEDVAVTLEGMATFSHTNRSEAVVAADQATIWAALTDPQLLVRLTPETDKLYTRLWTEVKTGK